MGRQSGGGGRVGYGSATNEGRKDYGGRLGVAGLSPTPGRTIDLTLLRRRSRFTADRVIEEVDQLVANGEAAYAYYSSEAAQLLLSEGRDLVQRNGRYVKGFRVLS